MDQAQLYYASVSHFLDPIKPFLASQKVTEVMINGPDRIYIERQGRIAKTAASFENERQLMAAVRNIAEFAGRPIGGKVLSMDGQLPDGNRVHIILPPASEWISVTIRKFPPNAFTLTDLVNNQSIEPTALEILRRAIDDHWNIVIAGGTGTGKTSLLNAMSAMFGDDERIVVIEDSRELQIGKQHVIYLQAGGMTVRELFTNALRMRPDRIIIGEVRRGETLDMVQAMYSGHGGSMTTIHASSPQTAATRLETLCLQNDAQLPIYVARAQVAAAINLFVQVIRKDGRRFVSKISRLSGLNRKQEYVWEPLYECK